MRPWLAALAFYAAISLPAPACTQTMNSSSLAGSKRVMLETHLRGRGITNPDVLSAMEDVPRERFVDKAFYYNAYDDNPLPIGLGQTISQPYIVALMTQVLRPKPTDKVLEVGTGSGYQAAVISRIVERVYTIEIVKLLADEAAKRFRELGYDNIESRAGDGYGGWVEHAPFDKIIVTAAAPIVPKPLEEQLAEGGLLVMPVGGSYVQDLLLGEKRGGVVSYKNIAAVRFVPLTGKAEER